jgi:segregation and condensation protein B
VPSPELHVHHPETTKPAHQQETVKKVTPSEAAKPLHHPITAKEETLIRGIKEVEAVLFASGKSMEEEHIVQLTGLKPQEAKKALAALKDSYEKRDSALFIWNEGDRWKINVKEVYISLVKSLAAETELSRAVLETLAVIAYRQPIARGRVSAVRGVNVDGVIRTLLSRGLIEEAGHDGESGAHLYRTTAHFLERMGIASLDDLPPLAEHLPDLADLEDVLDSVATGE